MKDVLFYVFLFALYGILALNWLSGQNAGMESVLTWKNFALHGGLFIVVATLARWSVMAFKRRAGRLLKGQKIVGIEEGEPDHVIDVLKPAALKREIKKPKLKRRRHF